MILTGSQQISAEELNEIHFDLALIVTGYEKRSVFLPEKYKPVGPKVFALISVLLATRYPDPDVWRVSAGSKKSAIERAPEGNPLFCRADFINDDSD